MVSPVTPRRHHNHRLQTFTTYAKQKFLFFLFLKCCKLLRELTGLVQSIWLFLSLGQHSLLTEGISASQREFIGSTRSILLFLALGQHFLFTEGGHWRVTEGIHQPSSVHLPFLGARPAIFAHRGHRWVTEGIHWLGPVHLTVLGAEPAFFAHRGHWCGTEGIHQVIRGNSLGIHWLGSVHLSLRSQRALAPKCSNSNGTKDVAVVVMLVDSFSTICCQTPSPPSLQHSTDALIFVLVSQAFKRRSMHRPWRWIAGRSTFTGTVCMAVQLWCSS